VFSPHRLVRPFVVEGVFRRSYNAAGLEGELMTNRDEKRQDSGSSPDRHKALTGKARDRRVQIVRVLLEGSFQLKLGLRDMSAKVNLSPWRLAHLFKSEIGMSPQRYLTLVRLQKAKDQLENSFLSVQEIGAAVGIPNPSQLTKSFKAAYGMTPVEYRKIHFPVLSRQEVKGESRVKDNIHNIE
jgi:AraC-like DNA-binding protein